LKGYILQSSWMPRCIENLYSFLSLCQYRACAPAISRECLYSTIFRLRFIAGLLSSRLSNCSLDFSKPLVFIALPFQTLSPKGVPRSKSRNLTIWCACVIIMDIHSLIYHINRSKSLNNLIARK